MFDILKACHDEPRGGHFVDKRIAHKVLHLGYYWPTLFKDAKTCVKSCDSCQRMGSPVQSNEMPLQPQVLIEPFERWDLDFVCPIAPMSRKKRYILVSTDYVTKWVQAKTLYQANEQTFVEFVFEDFFTHFGDPREIVTDQGTQFMSELVKSITQQYKIIHKTSSPYHPQANE